MNYDDYCGNLPAGHAVHVLEPAREYCDDEHEAVVVDELKY